jgi:hypothetical protein
VLAAPVLATVALVGRYLARKLFDLPPWPPEEAKPKASELTWRRIRRRAEAFWLMLQSRRERK